MEPVPKKRIRTGNNDSHDDYKDNDDTTISANLPSILQSISHVFSTLSIVGCHALIRKSIVKMLMTEQKLL